MGKGWDFWLCPRPYLDFTYPLMQGQSGSRIYAGEHGFLSLILRHPSLSVPYSICAFRVSARLD